MVAAAVMGCNEEKERIIQSFHSIVRVQKVISLGLA